MDGLSKAQRVCVALAAAGFVIAGSLHLIRPEPYLKIMPAYLPWHSQLVALSGFFEVLGGLGLFIPQLRRAAAWSVVALLVAVFPANVYMVTNPLEAGAASIAPILRWGRLPLQFVLIWWVLWCTRPRATR